MLLAALTVAALAPMSPAAAVEPDTRPCVSLGEFTRTPAGLTRHQIETRWETRGKWNREHSDPGHDTYDYSTCRGDARVRVTYARHTRIWTLREWAQF